VKVTINMHVILSTQVVRKFDFTCPHGFEIKTLNFLFPLWTEYYEITNNYAHHEGMQDNGGLF